MRILIIGLGSIAKKHINALNELGNYEIFAYRSKSGAATFKNVINVYDFDNLDQYDFFLISNPTHKHFEILNRLKDISKPIFIEKPLFEAISNEKEKLVEQISSLNERTYVGCNLRFLKSLQYVKDLVGNLRINEINIYAGSFLPEWRPDLDFRKTYSANENMGGGVHIDLIHELDYLYWIVGIPNRVNKNFCKKSSLDINAVDYANYLWEYDGFCANIILNYYRRDSKRTFEIVTDRSTLIVDLIKNEVTENGKIIFSSDQDIQHTYKEQMHFFLNQIINQKANTFNDISTAYKVLNLCLKN